MQTTPTSTSTSPLSPTTHYSLQEISEKELSRTISIQCKRAGFNSLQQQALFTLRQATCQFLESILLAALASAEIAGRARPCPLDVTRALSQKGLDLAALETELNRSRCFLLRMEGSKSTTTQRQQQRPKQHSDQSKQTATPSGGVHTDRPFLNPIIDDTASKAAIALIPEDADIPRLDCVPAHLPPFPARHTYVQTPVFKSRETNPVLLRQIGAEQSRLVEDSLKRLLAVEAQAAASLITATTPSHDVTMQDASASSQLTPERNPPTTKTNSQQQPEHSTSSSEISQHPPSFPTIPVDGDQEIQKHGFLSQLLGSSIATSAPIANYEAMRQLDARKKSKTGRPRRHRLSS